MSRLPVKTLNLKSKPLLRFLVLIIATASLSAWATPNVSLAWEPSWDTDVVGYKIYYGTTSHSYSQWVDAGNATNATIALTNYDTTYYFAATTYDASGAESAFSNETTYSAASEVISNPPPPVYTSPTLSAIANVSINENAGGQSVALSGITTGSGSSVTVSASSSNPALIPNPAVAYTSPSSTGSLSFTPVSNVTGSAVITVTLNNGEPSNNIVSRSFTITVNPVYISPTLSAIANVSINENAGGQSVTLSGITTGSGSLVTVSASSSNPALIPNPAVAYTSPNPTGSLSFTPVSNAAGSAVITVTLNNGEPSNNIVSRSFTITVNPVYTSPTLSAIANVSINENAGGQSVALSGITTGSGSSVTISASSSNPALIPNPAVAYTSPSSTGSLSFTPASNAAGSAVITVTLNNGEPSNNIASRSFTVTVTAASTAINQAPTLNAIEDMTLSYNASAQTIALSGISAGAPNEVQPLTISASSSNPALIPTPAVTYSSPLTTGTLSFKPKSKSSGSAIITVTVNDGGSSNNITTRSFNVTVLNKNGTNSSPTLVSQPKNQKVLLGKSATFKVSATGQGTLKYQWKYNGVNIAKATRPTLKVKNCREENAGLYSVKVYNSAGVSESEPAALMVAATPAATLMSFARAGSRFSFEVVGVTGYKYAVESTTDLIHWTSVETNIAPFTFVDSNADKVSGKYYRTAYIPTP
jgi:hypothetical protein